MSSTADAGGAGPSSEWRSSGRQVNKVERKKETFSDKGLKAEEMETLGYDVTEVMDFGLPSRDVWNEVDRIQEFLQRVKQAINRANKTELVDLS